MYDELTKQDIQKMQEEIDYRVQQLRPKLIEDVQTARAFGDLSENFEYKCAKQEKNRNDSRIRYLQRMIKTAKVIGDKSTADTVGLYDTVDPDGEYRTQPYHSAGDHAAAGRPEGLDQQGVAGGPGRYGPQGRGAGLCGDGEREGVLLTDQVYHQGQ